MIRQRKFDFVKSMKYLTTYLHLENVSIAYKYLIIYLLLAILGSSDNGIESFSFVKKKICSPLL